VKGRSSAPLPLFICYGGGDGGGGGVDRRWCNGGGVSHHQLSVEGLLSPRLPAHRVNYSVSDFHLFVNLTTSLVTNLET